MKNILLILIFSCLNIFAAQEGFKISGYPNKPVLAPTDLFITATPGVTNNNISYEQLLSQISSGIYTNGNTYNVDLVSDLLSLAIPIDSSHLTALVSGRTYKNDGAGGIFFYSSTSIQATNLGTIFASNNGVGRWLRVYTGNLEATWFGAVGDGLIDDTPYVVNAYNTLAAKGGGTLKFSGGVNSIFKFNLTINDDNIKIVGDSYGGAALIGHPVNIRFQPADFSKPIIQVANDSKYVLGFQLENVILFAVDSVNNNLLGQYAINLLGGTHEATIHNVSMMYFKNGLSILGGNSYPITSVTVDGFSIHSNTTDTNARAIKVAWTGPIAGFVTAIHFFNGNVQGPTTTDSYALETDGVVTGWSSVYMDVLNGHGWLLSKHSASSFYPSIVCHETHIDAGNVTNIAANLDISMGGLSRVASPSQWSSGTFGMTGYFQTSNGYLFNSGQGSIPQDADGLTLALGIGLSLYDVNSRLSGPGPYTFPSDITVRAVTNDLWLQSNHGRIVVNPAQNMVVVSPADFHGYTQIDGDSFAVTSSTSTNTGEYVSIRHNGNNGIIGTASYGVRKTPLILSASGGVDAYIDTNSDFNVTGHGYLSSRTEVLGTDLYVTSSSTKSSGEVLGLVHNGTGGYIQTLSYGVKQTPLIFRTGGPDVLVLKTNGGVTIPALVGPGYAIVDNLGNLSVSTTNLFLTTGLGITNNGGLLSNNIVAGTGITILAGTGGKLTISSSSTNGGTVTSVGVTAPPQFTVTSSPVVNAGTIGLNLSGIAFPISSGGTGGNTLPLAKTAMELNTGLGITNRGGAYSNNIVAGSNMSIAAGPDGQLTLTSTGGLTIPTAGVVLSDGAQISPIGGFIQPDLNGNVAQGGFIQNRLPNFQAAMYINQTGGTTGAGGGNGLYLGYAQGYDHSVIFDNQDPVASNFGQFLFNTVAVGNVFRIESDGNTKFIHIGGGLAGIPAVVAIPSGQVFPLITVVGNDSAFDVTYQVNTALASTALFTVTFARPYTVAPHIVWSASNDAALNHQTYLGFPTSVTSTGFTFMSGSLAAGAAANGNTYKLTFHVIE